MYGNIISEHGVLILRGEILIKGLEVSSNFLKNMVETKVYHFFHIFITVYMTQICYIVIHHEKFIFFKFNYQKDVFNASKFHWEKRKWKEAHREIKRLWGELPCQAHQRQRKWKQNFLQEKNIMRNTSKGNAVLINPWQAVARAGFRPNRKSWTKFFRTLVLCEELWEQWKSDVLSEL